VGTDRPVGLYWEDYTYLGVGTFLLALISLRRVGRQPFGPLWLGAIVGFLFAIGQLTPFYALVWHLVPGVALFRFPTRALMVTELALALLAGLALRDLAGELTAFEARRGRVPRLKLYSALAVALITADLWAHQPRQNAWGDATDWLAPPNPASFLQRPENAGRYFTLGAFRWHAKAHEAARGLTDLRPYFDVRSLLGPNKSLYWGLRGTNGYSSVPAAWSARFWSSGQQRGVLDSLLRESPDQSLVAHPRFAQLLRLGHVRWVIARQPLAPAPGTSLDLEVASNWGPTTIWEVPDPQPRAWVVPTLSALADDEAVVARMLEGFDPNATALVTTTDAVAPPGGRPGPAVVIADTGEALDIDAEGPGVLVIADTWYPGWVAEVDGVERPIWRTNLWQRGIPLGPGTHRVHLAFALPKLAASQLAEIAASCAWAAWAAATWWTGRDRSTR